MREEESTARVWRVYNRMTSFHFYTSSTRARGTYCDYTFTVDAHHLAVTMFVSEPGINEEPVGTQGEQMSCSSEIYEISCPPHVQKKLWQQRKVIYYNCTHKVPQFLLFSENDTALHALLHSDCQ